MITCRTCGAPMAPASSACTHCGTPAAGWAPPPDTAERQRVVRRTQRRAVWTGRLALLTTLAVLVALVALVVTRSVGRHGPQGQWARYAPHLTSDQQRRRVDEIRLCRDGTATKGKVAPRRHGVILVDVVHPTARASTLFELPFPAGDDVTWPVQSTMVWVDQAAIQNHGPDDLVEATDPTGLAEFTMCVRGLVRTSFDCGTYSAWGLDNQPGYDITIDDQEYEVNLYRTLDRTDQHRGTGGVNAGPAVTRPTAPSDPDPRWRIEEIRLCRDGTPRPGAVPPRLGGAVLVDVLTPTDAGLDSEELPVPAGDDLAWPVNRTLLWIDQAGLRTTPPGETLPDGNEVQPSDQLPEYTLCIRNTGTATISCTYTLFARDDPNRLPVMTFEPSPQPTLGTSTVNVEFRRYEINVYRTATGEKIRVDHYERPHTCPSTTEVDPGTNVPSTGRDYFTLHSQSHAGAGPLPSWTSDADLSEYLEKHPLP